MGNELRRRALLPFFSSPPRLSACSNFNLRSFARVHKFFISCPIIDAWQKTQKPLLTAIKSIVRPHRRHLPPFPSSSPFPLDCNEKAAYKSFNGRSTLALSMGTRTCWLYIGQSGTRLAWTRPPHANDMQKAFIESSHFARNQRFAFIIRVQNETRIRFRSLWTDDRLAVVSYPEDNQ